jgi:predicted flavoprotein YhiN
MIAAGRAAELGARVLLLEKMERPGQKILMTGNGRCNLTNCRDLLQTIVTAGF